MAFPGAWIHLGSLLRTGIGFTMLLFLNASPAAGYTPDDPEVQEMLKRATEFLRQHKGTSHGAGPRR